jgi:hypothetical protein
MRASGSESDDHHSVVTPSEDTMSVARTIEPPSHQSLFSGSSERSSTTVRAVLLAVIATLTVALLTGAYVYFGTGADDGDPGLVQQWTD